MNKFTDIDSNMMDGSMALLYILAGILVIISLPAIIPLYLVGWGVSWVTDRING